MLQPSPMSTNQQRTGVILTWIVYFVLAWQYKNYVSDNAIEQLLKFVQQLLFCIGELIKDHTELCIVLATNIPTSLYSARKLLKIDRDNFQQYVVCPKCTKLYQMDEVVINEGHRTVARTCILLDLLTISLFFFVLLVTGGTNKNNLQVYYLKFRKLCT